MVTHEFEPYDFTGVKDMCISLVNQAKSFTVSYKVDQFNKPAKWIIEVK